MKRVFLLLLVVVLMTSVSSASLVNFTNQLADKNTEPRTEEPVPVATIQLGTILAAGLIDGTIAESTADIALNGKFAAKLADNTSSSDIILSGLAESLADPVRINFRTKNRTLRNVMFKKRGNKTDVMLEHAGVQAVIREVKTKALDVMIDAYEQERRLKTPVFAAIGDAEQTEITLPKNGPVTTILKCADFDLNRFVCPSEWIDSGLPFADNGTHVIFNTTSFSGYGGGIITIINVQSYPTVGGNWTVSFTTDGTANLTIRASNGTTWSETTEDEDLKFFKVTCGGSVQSYIWTNNSVFIENYSCTENGTETSKVLTPGKHHIEFNFGGDIAYAHNDADMFETGIVDTDGSGFIQVNTKRNYSVPIVVARPREGREISADHEVATAIVTNITSNSFLVQLRNESVVLTGNVSYIVVENGSHILQNGMLLQAGRFEPVTDYNANGASSTSGYPITFYDAYGTPPSVIASPNNDSAQDWLSTRYDTGTLTTTGVTISLELDQLHGTAPISALTVGNGQNNSIGWIAMNRSNLTNMEAAIEAAVDEDPAAGDWRIVTFNKSYATPLFFAQQEEASGTDSSTVGIANLTSTNVQIRLTEDRTDGEQTHATEDVVWMVFESGLSNLEPTPPTNILCNNDNNCNITVDTSVVLNASGSNDFENDTITYFIEASLRNESNTSDLQTGEHQFQANAGGLTRIGETGEVNISNFVTQIIQFKNTYNSTPVVLATPVTQNGAAGEDDSYIIPTISLVNTTSFNITLCQDNGAPTCNTTVAEETVNYFVFDVNQSNQFSWIDVGTLTVTTAGADTTLTYGKTFGNVPVIWTTAQTYNQGSNISAIVWAEDAATKSTSSAPLIGCTHQEVLDACDVATPSETVGYVAIDTATEQINDYQTGSADIVDSSWTNATFSPSFTTPRVMVTQNDDDGAQDPQYPWARLVTSSGMEFRYCEQDAADDCDTHTGEVVNWFALEEGNITVDLGADDRDNLTDFVIYNNTFNTDWKNITRLNVTIAVSEYNNSGSLQSGTSNPDLELQMFNGTTFVHAGNFSVNGVGNFTINVTESTILTGWRNASFTDLRIRGFNFDFNVTADTINWTDVIVGFNGSLWTAIGNHSETTTFTWDTSERPEETGIDLRARAIDNGSNAFSPYFTKNAFLNISHFCPVTINENTTLTQNATSKGTCISFGADDIFLDCAGFSLIGNGTGIGVNATDRTGITIRDCVIEDFNQNILLLRTNNSLVLNNTARNANAQGIEIQSSNNNEIANNTAQNNNTNAIDVTAGNNNTLTNNFAGSGSSTGIRVDANSENNTLIYNNATSNTSFGIFLDVVTNNTLRRNNVSSITNAGLVLLGGNKNVLIDNLGISTLATGIILSSNAQNNSLINNTGKSNGGSSGIELEFTSINNLLANNTGISVNGSGILLELNSNNNTLENNTGITTTGIGIFLSSSNNLLNNNTGISNSNAGIGILGQNNTVINNTGTSVTSFGIALAAAVNTTFRNNIGNSSSGPGLNLQSNSRNNLLVNNTGTSVTGRAFTVTGTSQNNTFINLTLSVDAGIGIQLLGTASNNSFLDTTIRSNGTWILLTVNNTGNNITRTLFDQPNGSIRILPLVTLPNSTNISLQNLNITFNNAFLNSTNLSFLNTSGEITLRNITFIDPKPIVDFEDDGTFVDCPSTICTEISFTANIFVYNVTQFTTYSSAEGITVPIVENVTLNSTFGTNFTTENLTVTFDATDNNSDSIKNITNFFRNDESIAVLNMPFEANNGSESTLTKDYSGFGNNGTVNGSLFWNVTGGVDGFGAYEFDGINDFIEIPDNDSLDITGELTITAWIKSDLLSGFRIIVDKTNSVSPTNYFLTTIGDEVEFGFFTGGFQEHVTVGVDLATDTWYHVAAVYDDANDNVKIYVNGTERLNVSENNSLTTNALPLFIGASSPTDENFNGTIDEVRIYNRTLSAEQILALYLNRTNVIVSNETEVGEVWQACVTPNDNTFDGAEVCSNNLTVRRIPGVLNITLLDPPPGVTTNVTQFNVFNVSANITCTNASCGNVTAFARHNTSAVVDGNVNVFFGNASVGAFVTDLPIGATVNDATSVLFFSVNEDTNEPNMGHIMGSILNTTHIRFMRPNIDGILNVTWYIAEFGIGVSVYRGRNQSAGNNIETNVSIGAFVNPNSTFIVPGGLNNTGTTWNRDDFTRMRLINETHIGLTAEGVIQTGDESEWQVVQYNGSFVQRGLETVPPEGESVTVTLGAPIETNRSFLIFSYYLEANAPANNFTFSGRILNSTAIQFARNGSNSIVNISWEVVQLPVGNTVQHAVETFQASETERNVTIAIINKSKAVAFSSSAAFGGLSTGHDNFTADDIAGHSMFTFNLTNTTNLKLTRVPTGSVAGVGWFVVEFSTVKTDFFVAINTTDGATPFFTIDANPQQCILDVGEFCQLNWTVNATGDIGDTFEFNVNASSNETDVQPEVSSNAIVRIIAPVVAAPSVVNLSPITGTQFLLNESVNITANVTSTGTIDVVSANVTLPNGAVITVPLVNGSLDIFNGTFSGDNLNQRGQYNITYFANDTDGSINATITTNFFRNSLDVIDIRMQVLGTTEGAPPTFVFANYSTAVISNISGLLNLSISINDTRVRQVNVTLHDETSIFSILDLDDLQPTTGLSHALYGINPDSFNFSDTLTVIVNATGQAFRKCGNWNFTGSDCIGNFTLQQNITPGQFYSFTLNSTDPGFSEFSPASDVALAPFENETFALAFIRNDTNALEFQLLQTNGTLIANVTVDTTVDTDSRISIWPINFTHVALSWVDGPDNTLRRQIFNRTGTNTTGVLTVDSNVGLFTDVSVAQMNDRFPICYANDADNDADFQIFNNTDGTQIVSETLVDNNIAPAATLQNLVECAGVNSTRFVYFWFDDQTNDASFQRIDEQGVDVGAPEDIDINVGETAQVAITAVDNNKFVMMWYDSADQDITIAIRDIDNNILLAPTDIDTTTGTESRVAITALRNESATSDFFVATWYNQSSDRIMAAVFNGTGTIITEPFTVDNNPNSQFRLHDVTARDPITSNTLCPGKFIVAYSNSTDQAIFKGFEINGTPWDGICGRPDLFVNSSDILFNDSNPGENQNITINATIQNIGTAAASNVLVQFFDNTSAAVQINGDITIDSLPAGSSVVVNVTYISIIGNRTILVTSDPDNTIDELNETNNNATAQLNVQAYTQFFGSVLGNLTLDDTSEDTLYAWNFTDSGIIYFFDTDSLFNFTDLQALGRNTTNGTAVNDFGEADVNLGMVGFNDSIVDLWATDNSTPFDTRNFTIFNRLVGQVPIINSSNASTFVTGILWDTGDDSTGEYDISDKEDLVFITNINISKSGASGAPIDYEIHVPSLLRAYRPSVNLTAFISELR